MAMKVINHIDIYQCEKIKAPKKTRENTSSYVYIEKELDEILSMIQFVTYELSIEAIIYGIYSNNVTYIYTYECSVYYKNEMILFNINLFENTKTNYILEFNVIQGERFSFGEILADIGSLMGLIIPGSLRLPMFDSELDISNHNMSYILEYLSDDSRMNQMHGMYILSQVANDLSLMRIDTFNYNQWNEFIEIIFKIFKNNNSEDKRLRLTIVYTLANIFTINIDWEHSLLEKAGHIAKCSFSGGYHTRRESLRLLYVISNKIKIPKNDIVKLIIDNQTFYNDKSAFNYSQKLLS